VLENRSIPDIGAMPNGIPERVSESIKPLAHGLMELTIANK
jgi:hypothetical protein